MSMLMREADGCVQNSGFDRIICSLRLLSWLTAAGLCLLTSAVHASGLQPASTLDTAPLFENSNFFAQIGVMGLFAGNIRLHDAVGLNHQGQPVVSGATETDQLDHFQHGYGSIKVAIGSNTDCMFSDVPALLANYDPGLHWVGRYDLARLSITSEQKGLTCSVAIPAGPGRMRLIAGYVQTSADVNKTEAISDSIYATLALHGTSHAWRFGLAYELPEYAMRAVFMYQQDQPSALTGTPMVHLPGLAAPVPSGGYLLNATVPRSMQLDVQSGIAPGWLALASLNWQRWSELQNLPNVSPLATLPDSMPLYMRDALTVRAGVARALNKSLLLFSGLSWTQGAASDHNPVTGVKAMPSNNSLALALGARYAINSHVDLKLSVSSARMNGGSYYQQGPSSVATQGGRFGAAWLFAEDLSIAVHY